MTIPDAAAAYRAVHALTDAALDRRRDQAGFAELHALQDAAKAARAWIAAHPDEARQHRIRGFVGAIHYALQEIAAESDPGRKITLALMLGEAADDLAGEARELEQAERDRAGDADRTRRLEQEQAARLLPRRADDALLRRMA